MAIAPDYTLPPLEAHLWDPDSSWERNPIFLKMSKAIRMRCTLVKAAGR
jgi:hypothetical protein